MVDVPKYNTLATMAKNELAGQGVKPVLSVPVFNASAQSAGASGGVAGAIGSAIENFALNSMAKARGYEKNARYRQSLNQSVAELSDASGQINALVGQVSIENQYNATAFMQKIDTVKTEWLSSVSDDKKQSMSTLWGAIAYPQYTKILKKETVARDRQQQAQVFNALSVAENTALQSAGVGDSVGVGGNLDLYRKANDSLVLSGAISPEQAGKNVLQLMGKMSVEKYITAGDFLGAKNAIDTLKKDKKARVFAVYADEYLNEQLAIADKNSRYLNNQADLLAQKQTKVWKQTQVLNLANHSFDYKQAVNILEQNRANVGEDEYALRSKFLQQFSPQAIIKSPVVADVLKDSNAILLDKNRTSPLIGGADALKQSIFKRVLVKRLSGLSIAQRKDMDLVQSIADDILPKVKFLDQLGGMTDVSRENLSIEIDKTTQSFKDSVSDFWTVHGQNGVTDGWASYENGVYKMVQPTKMGGTVFKKWQSIVSNQKNTGQKIKQIKALIGLLHTNKVKDTDDDK